MMSLFFTLAERIAAANSPPLQLTNSLIRASTGPLARCSRLIQLHGQSPKRGGRADG